MNISLLHVLALNIATKHKLLMQIGCISLHILHLDVSVISESLSFAICGASFWFDGLVRWPGTRHEMQQAGKTE